MAKIYTKTGDSGETSLVSGNRVLKGNVRIETYGEVDELNSHLGMIAVYLSQQKELANEVDIIQKIQNHLFNLGSNLACERENRIKYKLPVLTEMDVRHLEESIDRYNEELPKLNNFILPGGSVAASQVHIARTVCRRVERKLVNYNQEFPEETPENAIIYINRLSDFLFTLGRFVNHSLNIEEVLWKSK
jgi:cob(I)alamin adenosyltransferase